MNLKIGLIDVDGRNFPNLALMKIAAYHKSHGNSVELVNHFERYDAVFMSKVFTFSANERTYINSSVIKKGGTGYKMYDKLFCDDTEPDYTLYPQYKDAYGFLTRGCIRKCPWCIVPKKEGYIQPYRDIETVLQGRKSAILMDNNVLASDFGLQQMEKIVDMKCRVDFNQGMDARLVTEEVAKLISKIKWIRFIRFSCDTLTAVDPLLSAIEKLNRYGVSNGRIFVYCLLGDDLRDSLMRIDMMKEIGVSPFAQPYIDFEGKKNIPAWQSDMAHWCNKKSVFKSTEFEDFMPRKDFTCKKYMKL